MKRKLLKIAVLIYLMVNALSLGMISSFAEEIKPIHEYNFDNDSGTTVVDSFRENPINGTIFGENQGNFYKGYNDIGKARYFNGIDDYIESGNVISVGGTTIRFKMKKDASSVTNKIESIISNSNLDYGIFIGIGAESYFYKDDMRFYPLNAKKEPYIS